MVFFRKIGKITVLHTELASSIKIVGRKLRKIGFFAKTINVLKSFSLQLVAQVTIVENTENSHNSRLYKIQIKLVRNSHLLSQKPGIFSKCHNNCYLIKHKLLTHKNLKGAINRSYTYCEEDYSKCYKHTPFFFKRTIVSTGVTNAQITKTINTY